jgi:hypothetical protein
MDRTVTRRRIHPLAELLYVRSLAFVKRSGTDGRIAANQLSAISPRIAGASRLARRLVDAELWSPNGDGWYVTAWLKRNPKTAEIHGVRSHAGLTGNHRRWHVGPDGVPSHRCELCRDERLV